MRRLWEFDTEPVEKLLARYRGAAISIASVDIASAFPESAIFP
jgi:hypothetical protein